MSRPGAHEPFDRFIEERPPSDRVMGFALAVPFALLGCARLLHGGAPRWWAVAVSCAFAFTALVRPKLLHPVAAIWIRLMRPVNRGITLALMGLLFLLVVTPAGLIRRLFVRDPLGLRADPAAATYWQQRTPPGPAPESMANQF